MTNLLLITNLLIACLGAIALQKNTDEKLKKVLTGIVVLSIVTLVVFFSVKAFSYLNN